MAVDTKIKRQSVNQFLPFWNILPPSDGTIGAADRQVISWIYAGIAAAVTQKVTAKAIAFNLHINAVVAETLFINKTESKNIHIDKGRSITLKRC